MHELAAEMGKEILILSGLLSKLVEFVSEIQNTKWACLKELRLDLEARERTPTIARSLGSMSIEDMVRRHKFFDTISE